MKNFKRFQTQQFERHDDRREKFISNVKAAVEKFIEVLSQQNDEIEKRKSNELNSDDDSINESDE